MEILVKKLFGDRFNIKTMKNFNNQIPVMNNKETLVLKTKSKQKNISKLITPDIILDNKKIIKRMNEAFRFLIDEKISDNLITMELLLDNAKAISECHVFIQRAIIKRLDDKPITPDWLLNNLDTISLFDYILRNSVIDKLSDKSITLDWLLNNEDIICSLDQQFQKSIGDKLNDELITLDWLLSNVNTVKLFDCKLQGAIGDKLTGSVTLKWLLNNVDKVKQLDSSIQKSIGDKLSDESIELEEMKNNKEKISKFSSEIQKIFIDRLSDRSITPERLLNNMWLVKKFGGYAQKNKLVQEAIANKLTDSNLDLLWLLEHEENINLHFEENLKKAIGSRVSDKIKQEKLLKIIKIKREEMRHQHEREFAECMWLSAFEKIFSKTSLIGDYEQDLVQKNSKLLAFAALRNNGFIIEQKKIPIILLFIQQNNFRIMIEITNILKNKKEKDFKSQYQAVEQFTRPADLLTNSEQSDFNNKNDRKLVFYFRNRGDKKYAWQGSCAVQTGLMIEDATMAVISKQLLSFNKIIVVPRMSKMDDFPYFILPNIKRKLLATNKYETVAISQTNNAILVNEKVILEFSDNFKKYENDDKSHFVELAHGTPQQKLGVLGDIFYCDKKYNKNLDNIKYFKSNVLWVDDETPLSLLPLLQKKLLTSNNIAESRKTTLSAIKYLDEYIYNLKKF